jgi:hypothetical protein
MPSCSGPSVQKRTFRESKMATGRHIGFRKNGVTRERIDRFSQNLTDTSRRQLLYWGLSKYSHSGESKMAADRHIGFRKNAVTRERIDQFSRNSTHTSRRQLLYWGSPRICIVGNPRWRPIAILDFERMLQLGNGLTDFHEI